MTNRAYAGVGSRSTPDDILNQMRAIGAAMSTEGFTLRSGGASGADLAFEQGCDRQRGTKEIYLPWAGFNGSMSLLTQPSNDAMLLAQEFHPNWGALSGGGRKLMARNAHQLLGKDLNDPVELVICWTVGGHAAGGTGQAIRMAQAFNIPVVNMGDANSNLDVVIQQINEIIDMKETVSG